MSICNFVTSGTGKLLLGISVLSTYFDEIDEANDVKGGKSSPQKHGIE